MSSKPLVFKEDEVERLQIKIRQVSQDTNRLYLQLRGQSSHWGEITPIQEQVRKAQLLLNELTVESEKLEDVIRGALKGVRNVQEENRRAANQLGQQWLALGSAFQGLGGNSKGGRIPIPTFAQKTAMNLIHTVANMLGWDALNQDPMVQRLQAEVKQTYIGSIENIAAQAKLKDIFEARDLIAKAQTAFGVYQGFGNQAQMEAMHELAEEARAKLESLGVNKLQYEPGKDLSGNFKKPALQACDYDPSITSAKIPLTPNESYLMLLRTAMEPGEKGAWAKGQLEGIQTTMKQMIATGVSLGGHVMTNQGGKAWEDVIKLTSSVAKLDSYHLFRKNKTEDEEVKPEETKNAFNKSIDSFKEIGTGFLNTLDQRWGKATDSPYDFFNWLTLGVTGDIPVGIYEGAKDRSEHMFDSKEKFADWLTLGTVETAKGAFNPDEAWSADHWLDSLGMATLLYSPVKNSLLPTGGGPKLPKGLEAIKDVEVQSPSPAFSTNEGLQFKIKPIDTDTQALPQTPVQINFKNEIDRMLREKMEGKGESDHSIRDVEVKASEGTGNVKPQSLMDELANSGVKYNPNDVVAVTRNADGKLVWLENGNSQAGLNHILNHADEFAAKGISQSQLPEFITKAVSEGEIVGYQGKGTGRPIYEVNFNGQTQRVAITTGGNGFIVGANPVSIK